MTHDQIVAALMGICPDAQWAISGDTYAGITWLDTKHAQPTEAALEAYVAPVIIAPITPRQARLALLGAGLLDQVNASVTAAGGASLITWEYASTIERTDPLILSFGTSLGLTSAQIDALFVTASTL
jgi:hypothetical protein